MTLSTTIEDIISHKKAALENKKQKIPKEQLMQLAEDAKAGPDFQKAITQMNEKQHLGVICEYKPASPSKGYISNFEVADVVRAYEKSGACAVSILTEDKFFKSNSNNLKIAKDHSHIPLLRKDFIIDPYQIYEARALGASSILLMTSLYPNLRDGIDLCRTLDMEPLVECSNRGEIEQALNYGAQIIGVNNRNFQDFRIDLQKTCELGIHVPSDRIMVSESGIKGPEDVKFLARSGADAVLVGSSIMASLTIESLEKCVKDLTTAAQGVRRKR